jgi:acetyl-CoA carboxylase beta subunit
MIAIGFDGFFTLCIVLSFVALAAVWLQHRWRTSAYNWNLSHDQLCRCRGCGQVFVAKRIESVARCPACNEMTRIRGSKRAKRMKY